MNLLQSALTHLPGFAVDVFRLGIWLLLLSLLFVPLERWLAVRPARLTRRELAINLLMYFVNSLLPAALLAMLMSVVAVAAAALIPASVPQAVNSLPLAARLLLAFVIGEIGFYWGHRLSHQIPWLWHFHAVHHRPEHLYFLVNTHAHPVDMIVTRLFGMTPLYVIGLAGASAAGSVTPVLVIILGTVWGFFIHSNLRLRFGPLEKLVATPAFHHWHHSAHAPLDRNFSSTLPVLDQLFGTLHLPAGWPAAYGIAPATPRAPATDQPVPHPDNQALAASQEKTSAGPGLPSLESALPN